MPSPPGIEPTRSVLIVHRYFWPENISETPQLLRTIAGHHLARGDAVRVVTGASGDFARQWDEAFEGKVAVSAFRAPVDRGLGAAQRAKHALRLLRLAISEMFGQRTDLLYVLSYPPLVGGLLNAFGPQSGRTRRAVYYVQDLFTYRIGNPILRRLYLAFSGLTIRLADRTVTLSEAMKRQLLLSLSPGSRAAQAPRIVVIPNACSDFERDPPGAPAQKAYDVIYAGAHGKPQNLDLFVSAMGLLSPGERPRAVFYGSGDARPALIARAEELGLGAALEFRAPVSRQEIAEEIAKARFGLVGALPGLMDYAFPSKLASYGALGVPSLVMCPEEGETADWLRTSGLGEPLDPVSPERAAEQLRTLFARRARAAEPRAVRAACRRQFGPESYLAALDRLLASLGD